MSTYFFPVFVSLWVLFVRSFVSQLILNISTDCQIIDSAITECLMLMELWKWMDSDSVLIFTLAVVLRMYSLPAEPYEELYISFEMEKKKLDVFIVFGNIQWEALEPPFSQNDGSLCAWTWAFESPPKKQLNNIGSQWGCVRASCSWSTLMFKKTRPKVAAIHQVRRPEELAVFYLRATDM